MSNPFTYFLGSSIVQKPAPAALPSAVAPTFGGITSLVQQSDGSLTASWSAATVVPNPPVRYEVYIQVGTATGLFSLSNLVGVTANLSLNTAFDAVPQSLILGSTYHVGVRAVDAYLNRTSNMQSLSATVTNASFNTLASAVWDVVRATRATAGTFGESLQARVDVDVSTRLATAGYTAPANSDIAAIKAKTDNLPASPASEASVTARPTLAQIEASTVLAKEATSSGIKAKTDNLPADPASETTVLTRLAASSYVAPANSDIAAIKAKTDNLPADPASQTNVSSRLAAAAYTAPDNAGITAIKAKTDNLPADPASEGNVDDVKKNTDLIPALV
jgi:hypothetical protein